LPYFTFQAFMQLKISTLFTSAALGLCGFTAQAQADFRPGYIVQAAGDTVRGEVDYRDARFSTRQCRFRSAPDASVTVFQPDGLRAFGLRDGSKHYRALALPAPAGASSQAATAPARRYFLEVLVNGPATLYSWRDDERTDHYFVATDTFPLTELVHRKVLLEQERIMQEQNIYRTTLAQALVGCPSAQAQLPALSFTTRALAGAVATYNACQHPQAQVLAAAPVRLSRQLPRFGLVLGAKRTMMHMAYLNVDLSLGPDNGPVGGLSLNLPLTALSRRLSLEAELLYESQRYFQTIGSGNANGGGITDYNFAMAYLRLPLLVRYTFPAGRLRPLVEVGPTLDYALKLTAETSGTDYFGHPMVAAPIYKDNQRRFQQGLSGGVGVQFGYWQKRQATILARYERDTGWFEGQGLESWSSHFYALLNLDLF
jgi:hypothetical protein